MCIYTFTDYLGCGCHRVHAKIPCLNAFDKSLPQCDRRDYVQGETVDIECPDCKPAFDNKSPLEPQTSSLRPQGRIMQEVSPRTKIKLTFNRSLIFREMSLQPEMEDNSHQFAGNLAQIDEQHNQFQRLTPYELANHRKQVFRNWLNDPEHAGPGREDGFTSPFHELTPPVQGTGLFVIPTEPWSTSEHNTNPVASRCRSRKQPSTLTSEDRRRRQFYGFKITCPSPPPTPSTTIHKTLSFRIKHGLTLTARQTTLSTSQRKAMARAGYENVRSLCVKTRRLIPQDSTSDGDIILRGCKLSASQRKAMARAGFPNVRKLSVISRRPRDPPS